MYKKMMELVNAKSRENTDLSKYCEIVTKAVHSVIPDAKVNVFKDYYKTITKDKITNSQARIIGKAMEIEELAKIYTYIRSETNDPAVSVQRFKEKRIVKKD